MATEKRLIDAKAGKKRFCAIAKPAEYNGVIHLVVPISEIDKLPTVDAVEVVHGHWVFKHNPIDDPKRYFVRIVCSNCNLHTGQKSNYCPQCGAKMDGDSSNG